MARPLVLRQRATEATISKFGGRLFAWGSTDCLKVVAFHLRQLGHKVPLSKGGQYRSALGAKGALKRAGCETVAEAMDKIGLQRIPPAFMLIGDVIAAPADHELGGLGIYAGNGNAFAYHESHASPVILSLVPGVVEIAWRAI
jgi:hypothetical protein